MILVGLGSNRSGISGSSQAILLQALQWMPGHGIDVVRCSPWYRTPAFGPGLQPDYVNGVALVRSALPPFALLETLHGIEEKLGRRRQIQWEARLVDLDLLDYDGMVIPPARLSRRPGTRWVARPLALPHEGAGNRPFVLLPLSKVAPHWRHPVNGRTAEDLLADMGPQAVEGIRMAGSC